MRNQKHQMRRTKMTKPSKTPQIDFSHTMGVFFSDWEDDDCAVRTDEKTGEQRFVITDQEIHNARIATERKAKQQAADERLAQMIDFDEMCGD